MRTIFDLPSHAFFIHLPLVLVPLSALAMLVIAIRPQWRYRFGPALVLVTLVGAVSAVIAARSGEELNEALESRIGDLAETHQSLGETTRLLTVGFFVAVLVVVAFDRWSTRQADDGAASTAADATLVTQRSMIGWGLTALAVVLGALATIWMIRTGHEGARIVWEGVVVPE